MKVISIEWYVPHYTPSVSNQAILSEQFLSRVPTELQNLERSVFMKEVKTQNLWTFELGTQEGINVPIGIIVDFQQRERQDSQEFNSDTFSKPSVTSAQCIIGVNQNLDSAIVLKCDDDDYCQGCGQIKQAFRALTKVDNLNCFKSDNDFNHLIMLILLVIT